MRFRIMGPVLAALAVLAATTAPPARATFSEIPRYHRHLDFNLTSPTAFTTAVGGFANPAVYKMLPGAEFEAYWADPKDSPVSGLNRWGMFAALRHFGFGVLHERDRFGAQETSVTDYRMAFSAGDQARTMGVSLGWSRGDTDAFARTTVVQVGMVERYGQFLSLGLSGTFSTETSDQTGLLDLAVRPLGDHRLTVFGDLEYPRGFSVEDAPWSVGAMVEVPAGVRLIGRYFDTEAFSFALAYTFGGGVGTGHMRGSAAPVYDSQSNYAGTNWGMRLGFAEENGLMKGLFDDSHYVSMALEGAVKHTRYKYFDDGMTFSSVLGGLEAARTDSRVAGVALNLSGTGISAGNAWEIRQKLAQIRREGKHVVVFIDEAGMTLYHIASVADRVVIDPEGLLLLPGYAMGRTYLARLAEKMGIGVEEWRFKDYKSAMESFVRREMSPEDREQRQALVDEYYRTMRGEVASSRRVSEADVDRWVNDLTVILPKTAQAEGLVDDVRSWEDVGEVITELEGSKKSLIGTSSLARFAYPSQRWGVPARIAVVYAIGGTSMDTGINARRLSRELRAVAGDRRIKAVVLRVNSPGGSPLAANLVADAVRRCAEAKPVIVSQGDVAASGGYWISMYGDEIVAQPTTITGSIGYISGWMWDEGLSDKVGLDTDFVKAGEHADAFFSVRFPLLPISLPHRRLTDGERERVLGEMGKMYDAFVARVAEGRGMTPEDVEKIAKGRVWTGAQGLENGLVDRIGGMEMAIAVARDKAGLADDEEVELVEYGASRGLFDPGFFKPGFVFANTRDAGDRESFDRMSFLFDYQSFYLRNLAEHNGRPMCLMPPDYIPQTGLGGDN